MTVLLKKFLFAAALLTFIGITGESLAANKPGNKEIKKSDMDTKVNPGVDFYDYANGNWQKNVTIPPQYPMWGTFFELRDNNLDMLHKILLQTQKESAKHGSNVQMVGDFFVSGMDTTEIEKLGYSPIVPELKKIDALNNLDDFYKELADIHLGYSNAIFSFSSGADFKDSKMEIAQLDQSGLGLPNRDYYTKEDDHSKKIREQYVQHVKKMFELTGVDSSSALKDANMVMNIETMLAKASLTNVEMRDPKKVYNKMPLSKIEEIAPNFNWSLYLKNLGVSNPGEINVAEPGFVKAVSNMMKEVSLNDWKTYLKWNVIRSSANYLSSPFVQERFDFYGTTLTGSKEMQPRWKRVLQAIDNSIGDQLGQLYVKDYFPPAAKTKAKQIVMNLIHTFGERIKNLDWMSDATKKQALTKLNAITIKIGYPDKWKSYNGLEITKGSYFQNAINSSIFNYRKDLEKIGKPVDKTEWEMTPQTVNAYYEPVNNEIVFPAAILQPPFFDMNADDAVNYGAMGCVIGHEMTHGFDDQGRQFDATGNMRDWWTQQDEENFNKKAELIVEQYDSFTPVDTLHINGKLTLGENIADLGGVNISFNAFEKTKQYKENKPIDGFTPAQRFFLSYANVWKTKAREQMARMLLQVDPHSPGKYRVIGPLSNTPAFWKAFDVKPGQPMMNPKDKLPKIW